MRYAVISDIHSNLEALMAFLGAAERLRVDKIICLGDVVGYNANPNECIEIVREKKMACVMGNHDARAAGLEDASGFNFMASGAIEWTRKALKPENAEFLRSLPRSLVVDRRFLAIHGSINGTDDYILGANDAEENLRLLREKRLCLCFFGHTHVAVSYVEGETGVSVNAEDALKLRKGECYLVNPGAVGQPRDRDPRASFAVFDTKKSMITLHRADYDVQATADKILAAGLPERLAERLKLGW